LKLLAKDGPQPCPVERGWFDYDGVRFSSRQRASPSQIPYILHPRNTLILDDRPLLRWHDTGASSYTVEIFADGQPVWSRSKVTGNQLRYPKGAPALQTGVDYLLQVRDEASGRISTEDPAKGLGFRLIEPELRAAIQAQQVAIERLPGLDASERKLALAFYYASVGSTSERRLIGEAILLVEEGRLAASTPAVQLWHGDLLRVVRLSQEAEAAYLAALRQAEQIGDTASQAAAHANLWRITGNATQFDLAINGYQALGEQRAVAVLRSEATP
jgi:hypothetical protein